MKKVYLLLLLVAFCTTFTHAQDSLVGNWITHYYKTEKKEFKCQDQFDIDRLFLHADGTYTKLYFIPDASGDAPIKVSYDVPSGKKKFFTADGNELKLVRIKKILERGSYKTIGTAGDVEFNFNNQSYIKRIRFKGQNLIILDTLDNKLFTKIYKRA